MKNIDLSKYQLEKIVSIALPYMEHTAPYESFNGDSLNSYCKDRVNGCDKCAIVDILKETKKRQDQKSVIDRLEYVITKTTNGAPLKVAKISLMECDECGEFTLRAKTLEEGGGVICVDDKCGYQFCF